MTNITESSLLKVSEINFLKLYDKLNEYVHVVGAWQ